MPSKADIAAVARKIWSSAERREGRQTVEAVLETYAALKRNRARRRVQAARRAHRLNPPTY